MTRLLTLLCLFATPALADAVSLSIANGGTKPLRCQIIYAHWVTGDLPVVAPAAAAELTVQRDPATRELYVPREPDGRRMMLEGVLCGADDDWSRTLVLLDLEAPKRSEAQSFERRCAIDERLDCSSWQPR